MCPLVVTGVTVNGVTAAYTVGPHGFTLTTPLATASIVEATGQYLVSNVTSGGAGVPRITGGSAVGSILTCTNGGLSSPAYQWFRDGVAISGATAATYTLATGDLGKSLTCVVAGNLTSGAFTVSSSEGGGVVPYDTWVLGATRGVVFDAGVATSGDGKRGFKFRRFQTILAHGDKLRLGFMAVTCPVNTDLAASADLTFTKVSVEIGGVVVAAPVAASRSFTVTGGTVLQLTDELDASAFGLTDFYGVTAFVSGMGSVPASAAIPVSTVDTAVSNGRVFTGEIYTRYDPANAVDDIDTPGVKANPTGGLLGNTSPFNNLLQVRSTAAQKSLTFWVDSKGANSNDFVGDGVTASALGVVGGGHCRRAAALRGLPYFIFGIPGAVMSAYVASHTKQDILLAALSGGASTMISQRLVNDVVGGDTLANMQTRSQAFYDACRTFGFKSVVQLSVASETIATSTYRDTTAGQQTLRSAAFNVGGVRDQLNTWLAAGAGGKIDNFINIHSTIYDPATNFWNISGRSYTLAANTTAFTQALSLTTAPPVGELICFGAGTANNVVGKVRGVTGSGPYTVALDNSLASATFLSGDTGLASPAADGVHEGPLHHITEAAAIHAGLPA